MIRDDFMTFLFVTVDEFCWTTPKKKEEISSRLPR